MRSANKRDRDCIINELKLERFAFGEPLVKYVLLRYQDGSRDIVMKLDHGL